MNSKIGKNDYYYEIYILKIKKLVIKFPSYYNYNNY